MPIDMTASRRWTLWLSALTIWTLLLITPGTWFGDEPARKRIAGVPSAKLLHVGVYSILAISAGWLPTSLGRRTLIVVSLIGHGGLTELVQTQIPARDGTWRDTGIDA